LGWTQLLRSGTLPAERVNESLERIERNANFLARLIGDLLDASRIIRGKLEVDREPMDLRTAAAQAVESLRGDADRRGIRLQHEQLDAPIVVRGSLERLEQAISNLLGNALKFSPDESEIAVAVGLDGRFAVVTITDHGEGIPKEVLPRIFQRFHQGDGSNNRRHGGLGLGLAIVRSIVELHGGRVAATSDGVGLGSTFTMRIPLASSSGPLPPVRRYSPSPVSLAGIRLVYVDDDSEAREILASVLSTLGARVAVASSVEEALALLHIESPHVVVSDLSMPTSDGFDLAERLRNSQDETLRRLPLVALTAHASVADQARAARAGFDAYISKPFDSSKLSRAILALARPRSGDSA
jgi:CheY-like chemotaxis protein